MTPAPMTPRRFGTCASSSAPQLSMISRPLNGALLSGIGTEPAASTTCLAPSTVFLPSGVVSSTCRFASSRPWPASPVTFAALNSCRMPCVEALTMPALRFCIVATSTSTLPSLMPCVANSSCARCTSSLDSSSAFDGMQPAFRHVPPKAWLSSRFFQSSMHATERPFWPARIAAG